MPTIFTRIIDGEIPGTFVHRDEHYTADGDFADPKFQQYIQTWIDKFEAWIGQING